MKKIKLNKKSLIFGGLFLLILTILIGTAIGYKNFKNNKKSSNSSTEKTKYLDYDSLSTTPTPVDSAGNFKVSKDPTNGMPVYYWRDIKVDLYDSIINKNIDNGEYENWWRARYILAAVPNSGDKYTISCTQSGFNPETEEVLEVCDPNMITIEVRDGSSESEVDSFMNSIQDAQENLCTIQRQYIQSQSKENNEDGGLTYEGLKEPVEKYNDYCAPITGYSIDADDIGTCNYDHSVDLLKFQDSDSQFAYYYNPITLGADFIDMDMCNSNSIESIFNSATSKADKLKVCRWFERDLYVPGKLDINDVIYIYNGTANEDGTYNEEESLKKKCSDLGFPFVPNRGWGYAPHRYACNPSDPRGNRNQKLQTCPSFEVCSDAADGEEMYYLEETKEFITGTGKGYINYFINPSEDEDPYFTLNGCDSATNGISIKDIAQKFEGGCNFLKQLAKDGKLAEWQVTGENGVNESCDIVIDKSSESGICNIKNDNDNNYYTYNGYYVSEHDYNETCSCVNYEENLIKLIEIDESPAVKIVDFNGGTIDKSKYDDIEEDWCDINNNQAFLIAGGEIIQNENYCIFIHPGTKQEFKIHFDKITQSLNNYGHLPLSLYKGYKSDGTKNRFSYWSTEKDCSKTSFINSKQDFSINGVSWVRYACYEDNSIASVNDDDDGVCHINNPTGDASLVADETYVQPYCSTEDDFENKAYNDNQISVVSNNNLISSTKLTKLASGNSEVKTEDYVTYSCKETINYKYPNTFETVKTGTYYKFTYNPDLIAYKECKVNISRDKWESDYVKYLKEEQENYYEWQIALHNKSAYNGADYSTSDCNCDEETGNCDTFYSGTTVDDIHRLSIEFDSNGKLTNLDTSHSTVSLSDCGSNPFEEAASDEGTAASEYETAYETAKAAREALENINLNYLISLDNYSNNSSLSTVNSEIITNTNDQYTLGEGGIYNKSEKTKDIDKFFIIDPIITFDTGIDNKKDELTKIVKRVVYDTGAHTLGVGSISGDQLTKSAEYISGKAMISNGEEQIDVKSVASTPYEGFNLTLNSGDLSVTNPYSINFNEYYTPENSIWRQSKKYFEYTPSTYYCGDNTQNIDGIFTACSTVSKNLSKLGYVYPIPLNIPSGKKDVTFEISGLTINNDDINILTDDIVINNDLYDSVYKDEYTEKAASITDHGYSTDYTNQYQCRYTVTYDAVVEEREGLGAASTSSNFKPNFFTRSIATVNVDPNKRYKNGTLGRNWASDKGQALIDIIEAQAKTSDTYKPENLEYSFILTPNTLRLIQEYNKEQLAAVHSYVNMDKFECNDNLDGCESQFLKKYVDHQIYINGATETFEDVTSKINNVWKYYLIADGTEEVTWVKYEEALTKEEYNNYYKKSGVLP